MIDNFLGINTDVGGGGDDFITQGMGQSSMFLTFRTISNFWFWVGWEEGKEESQGSFIPVY